MTGLFILLAMAALGEGFTEIADTLGHRPIDLAKKYMIKGDRAYAFKSSYLSFEQSMIYYDSARIIAMSSGDSLLLGYVYYSYGKVYDAWNKAPQKTIEYFTSSERLLRKYKAPLTMIINTKYLVAHNYEKAHDSADACRILTELESQIDTLSDSQRDMPIIVEMALASSETGNYALASKILGSIRHPQKIRNDLSSYLFRDHYVLTKARMDVYYLKMSNSQWLDSMAEIFSKAASTFDSLYYSDELANMYDYVGRYKASCQYLRINQKLYARINEQSGIGNMQNKLLKSELNFEKSKTETETLHRRQAQYFTWLLVLVILMISIFSYILYRQKKASVRQSREMTAINKDLEIQSEHNNLLSLEVHHRTKNNLQMILSLIQMQERTLDNEEAREKLQEARTRIENIAALHENLLTNNHHLDIKSYISTLIHTMTGGDLVEKNIVAHVSVDSIPLQHRVALPLALILSEWITNTIKYAGSETGLLEIHVKLYQDHNYLCIDYRDNGPDSSNIDTVAGFGTQIIRLLVKQVKGHLTFDPQSKFHYTLQIPNADKDQNRNSGR